jgi:hypothetical protein
MTAAVTDGPPEITLKDVIVHMEHMEQRLSGQINELFGITGEINTKIDALERKLTIRMNTLERTLTERIDALEEDLTATMKDTIVIRKHVGIYNGEED